MNTDSISELNRAALLASLDQGSASVLDHSTLGKDAVVGSTDLAESTPSFKFRLQTKILFGILALEILLMSAIIFTVNHQQRNSILSEFEKRASAVTTNIAAINGLYMTTYDYVQIEQNLKNVVTENGLVFAAVIYFDGEQVLYKKESLSPEQLSALENVLKSPVVTRSDEQHSELLLDYVKLGAEETAQVSIPVSLNGENWGSVRTGFSLNGVQTSLTRTRMSLLILGGLGLILGYLASVFIARRITRPVGKLVTSVQSIANGEYNQPIQVDTQDEIGFLGHHFAIMQNKLKDQIQQLASANLKLSASNRRLEHEVLEHTKKDKKIHQMAYYDDITGLLNRALLTECLKQILENADPTRQGAVFLLDLDQFKRVNDTLGHSAGDRLLREVGNRLTKIIRDYGYSVESNPDPASVVTDEQNIAMIGRLGGDEFVVILPKAESCAYEAIAQGIIESISAPVVLKDTQIFVTVSIGVSIFPDHGRDVESMLRHADTAMYHAKGGGRNEFAFFTPAMNDYVQERLSLENELRRCVENDGLELFYQPKADTRTGRIVGMEALLRWRLADNKFVPPDKFIPIAEDTGLIIPIGEWVMWQACKQFRNWQVAGIAPPMLGSINMSAAQFRQNDLCKTLRKVLRQTGLAPESLELELTESMLMEGGDASIAQLHELKAIGVQLSIDDFGTGYSSLNYLKKFPIDTLKIDKSFIRDITTEADDAAIVNATIALGHSLRLQIVAEGVEEIDQLEFLKSHHCDVVQGYLLSKPLSADEFLKFLRSYSRQRAQQAVQIQTAAEPGGHVSPLFVASKTKSPAALVGIPLQ